MAKYRNYWAYSLGCYLVWAVLMALVATKVVTARGTMPFSFSADG